MKKNYFIEEINRDQMMSMNSKKICTALELNAYLF